jgi:hypothetical protein
LCASVGIIKSALILRCTLDVMRKGCRGQSNNTELSNGSYSILLQKQAHALYRVFIK